MWSTFLLSFFPKLLLKKQNTKKPAFVNLGSLCESAGPLNVGFMNAISGDNLCVSPGLLALLPLSHLTFLKAINLFISCPIRKGWGRLLRERRQSHMQGAHNPPCRSPASCGLSHPGGVGVRAPLPALKTGPAKCLVTRSPSRAT